MSILFGLGTILVLAVMASTFYQLAEQAHPQAKSITFIPITIGPQAASVTGWVAVSSLLASIVLAAWQLSPKLLAATLLGSLVVVVFFDEGLDTALRAGLTVVSILGTVAEVYVLLRRSEPKSLTPPSGNGETARR